MARMVREFSKKDVCSQNILKCIYRYGKISRPALSRELGISLPTVIGRVNDLVNHDILISNGTIESSLGRKAESVGLNPLYCYAIGIDITQNHVSFVITDFSGEMISHVRYHLAFSVENNYYRDVYALYEQFLRESGIDQSKIIGIGISLPGILSKDGKVLLDSHALRVSNLSMSGFERLFSDYPLTILNDACAAALAEKRLLPPCGDLAYISLSNSVGGAVFIRNELFQGVHNRSCEFGHIVLYPNGKRCYCGQKGCFDAYCTALNLSTLFDGKLERFFTALEKHDAEIEKVWDEYTDNLALMCNNIHMSYDCDVMLGGYVGGYLEPYLSEIRKKAAEKNIFDDTASFIVCCHYKYEAAATGAALQHIEEYMSLL